MITKRKLRKLKRRRRKCQKRGHDLWIQERSGLQRARTSWAVAFEIAQQRTVCRRCGHVHRHWHETHHDYLTSISLPFDDHRTFKRTGYLWDDWHWWIRRAKPAEVPQLGAAEAVALTGAAFSGIVIWSVVS